ncbi:MAG: DUF3172 domain-containing protein [Leptolyngbyaceae bacterium]|nr:DUF3172 domain-containing protein [Leptolyngbyaceae bacterium]
MKRKSTKSSPVSSRPSSSSGFASALNSVTLAILAGVFILGIGLGIGFSSTANSGPENIASREAIDRAAPDPELCVQFGASAIAMDTRLFVTLNPFNVYVSRPKMQPGCVLRQNNWAILEQRNLVSSDQVRECKNRMNTFAYTGSIDGTPQINCIYQNDPSDNKFLSQMGGSTRRESQQF